MDQEIKDKMFKAAAEAQKNAYVPYSHFPLGAAVLTADGEIFTGVNIENASFSLSNCAERSAIFKAVSAGKRELKALLLLTSTENPVTPCGACRQVIEEFAAEGMEVIMMTENGKELQMTAKELLPGAFTDSQMGQNNGL